MAEEYRSVRQPGGASAAFAAVLALAAALALFDLSLHAAGMRASEALQTLWLWLALAGLPALALAACVRLALRLGPLAPHGASAAIRSCALAVLAISGPLAPAIALLHRSLAASTIAVLTALALAASWPLARRASRSPFARMAVHLTIAGSGALALVALVLPEPGAGRAPLASDRLHVVVIVLDTQRADHLGAYGHQGALSPAFDALAGESTLYENCFATASWTVPSHASLFTGLHPISHGASFDHHRWLDARFDTLAEGLRAAGYRTAGFSANDQLAIANLDQGFERFTPLGRPFRALAIHEPLQLLGAPARWMDLGAADAAGQVARFLSSASSSRAPVFLFINLLEPHWRYLPPLRERLALLPDGVGPLAATLRSARFYGPLAMAGEPVSEDLRETIASLYAAEVLYQDRQLRRLLAVIDQHLDAERTLLIVTADHGENLGEAGRWDHVFALNDHLIRVPLLIRNGERFPPGLRVSGMCQLVDIPATVSASVGGIALAPGHEGRDLAPATFSGREVVVAEGDPYRPHLERMARHAGSEQAVARFAASLRSIRSERYKYVWSSRGEEALYDVVSDPDERFDRIDELPAEAAALRARLAAWLDRQPPYDPLESETHALGEAERRRLEALGYAE